MNLETLQHRLETLSSLAEGGDRHAVDRLRDLLKRRDDWGLIRMNPLRLAREEGIESRLLVDLFILGAKVGLFDFVWNTVCPHCGNVAFNCDSFDEIEEDSFFCMICHWALPNTLDEEVETAFDINPGVKRVRIDPFEDVDSYCRYFFSPNFELSPELDRYMKQMQVGFLSVPPDETREISFDGAAGANFRLVSLDKHSVFFVGIKEVNGTGGGEIEVEALPSGFSKSRVDLAPGRVTLRLKNLDNQTTGALLMTTELDAFYRVLVDYPAKPLPFLSGKMLLNNQTFREHFRLQNLRPDLKLNIKSLTVLFTDLRGSTELYDREGDGFAYGLIQRHFQMLTKAVRANSGAIVKTMGDAIMATFSTPEDGIRAAVDMMGQIRELNSELEGKNLELGLKVGLHEGPTLAVNAEDRLDYFGQTVNIAARVQGLAKAGEIWFTEGMLSSAEKVSGPIPLQERCSVKLKGVGADTVVYCLRTAVGEDSE